MDAPDSPPQLATSPPITDAVEDPHSSPYASLNSHCHDLSTLQDLACRGAWRTVLDKVARSRSLSLLSHPHEHLIYLAFNVLALVKLRRYADAQQELETLDSDLESKQYLFESFPDHYPNRKPGSMIPFALRWLHAHLPFTLGDRQLSLDRLYALLHFIRDAKLSRNLDSITEISMNLWKKRETFVVNSIVTHHLSLKEFKVCLYLLKAEISKNEDPFLVSKLGYVQMQYGDLDGAKRSFELVEKMVEGGGSGDVNLKNLMGRNKALLYLVGKDYVSAVREYEECMERDGSDVVAINNKALCLMYLRDLSDSIKVLESALERVPTVALNETLVVNLCSMYELAYVNHADIKKTLSTWIARVAPDDFDASCTRI
ncbi:Tetratricopeptide repeat superfamily protein [Perilla frutescens var. hirtella]|uniref:Tetratricopeptide repeat superfamily protein n=1 Tax=Perilla frutescens var. hirtella TaxID=608512 RepID=A0AAD4JBB8_PERFH|nr:Tetratricopeptide repeat superfamily protein [Perilla frutescens var. frutescens]KAH6784412.1 Tetratricopeptide repeat superfamily protein [Perilla frutescens var. hirtella]KAH6830587.1 Tetratricopeptide repeat superfamily protein [Perilla frutescens var. hirtella]